MYPLTHLMMTCTQLIVWEWGGKLWIHRARSLPPTVCRRLDQPPPYASAIGITTTLPTTCLNIGEGSPGVMTEPAHHLSRVTVVVRVAPVGRVQAQFSAFVHRTDVLIDRIDGFKDSPVELLELAEFGGFVDAVVFHVVVAVGGEEGAAPRDGDAVHVGKFAGSRCVVVTGGSETKRTPQSKHSLALSRA